MTPDPASTLPAPEPPRRFRGGLLSDAQSLRSRSGASGPLRIAPRLVAIPTDAEDVATLVEWAGREGLPLTPRGAGTGMPGGNVGRGVCVDLSALVDPLVTHAAPGLVEAAAGVTGGSLAAAAATMGRFFPALPSSADRCTVGGMVANNAAGVRSFGYGAVHAWVEGVEAVLADGSLTRLFRGRGPSPPSFAGLHRELAGGGAPSPLPWPRVRKNSSGYALDRYLPGGDPLDLVVGSEGTLAVVTRVWLRTAPLPEERALALVPVPGLEALDPLVRGVSRVGASVCEFFGDRFLEISGVRRSGELGPFVEAHPALLLVEVDGSRQEVEEALAGVEALAASFGVPLRTGRTPEAMEAIWRVRHAASPVVAAMADEGLVSMQFVEDSVVPPGRLTHYLVGLSDILSDQETDAVVFGHAGDGNVHVNPLVDVRRPDWRKRVHRILEDTAGLVADLGGTLSGEHGDGRFRAPFHDLVFGAPVAAAFRRVKQVLDPAGVLNPGVVVPSEGADPLEGLSRARRIG